MARKRDSTNGGLSSSSVSIQDPILKPYTLRQLRAFQLVLGVAALWWIVLLTGILTSSNPPRLDAFLVEQCDFIVEAKLESPGSDELHVLNCRENPKRSGKSPCKERKSVSRDVVPQSVNLQAGLTYLLPIREVDGKLRWLSAEMYDTPGVDTGRKHRRVTPIAATDLTRLELTRALEDLQRPMNLDGIEVPPLKGGAEIP